LIGSFVKVENIWGQESLAEADRKDAEVLDRGEKREGTAPERNNLALLRGKLSAWFAKHARRRGTSRVRCKIIQ